MPKRQAQAGTFQRADLEPRASEERWVQGCAWQPQNTHGEHPRLWVGLEGSGLFLGEANALEVWDVKGAPTGSGTGWASWAEESQEFPGSAGHHINPLAIPQQSPSRDSCLLSQFHY